jgi:hypothetical protein
LLLWKIKCWDASEEEKKINKKDKNKVCILLLFCVSVVWSE